MTTGTRPAPDAARLLELVRQVATELHPDRAPPRLGLDSDLSRDAGLDSLGRVELMLRLHQRLGLRLADTDAIAARTPRDLLAAAAPAPAAAPGPAPAAAAQAAPAPPERATTLVEVLDYYAEHEPDRVHLTVSGEAEGGDATLTYGALRDGAAAVAAGLRARGLEPGDSVALMLPTGLDFFHAFHGVLRAGGVPVPLYPPFRADQLEAHARRTAGVLDNAGARLFVGSAETRPAGRILRALVASLRGVVTVAELRRSDEPPAAVPRGGRDRALLQYTSGTTGDPKGVMLSHDNLLANIRAMGPPVDAGPGDRFASWLPLYHDMGLIGACLATLYYGIDIVLLSPLHFMARPQLWLWTIHRYRATISAGPNFAYDLCARRIDEAELAGLDLSSWRLAFNGAEPVSADTLEAFAARFEPYGFRRSALMPVYGLAESSVGLAFPPLGRGPVVDRIRRQPLAAEQRAVPAGPGDSDVLRVVSCGRVLPGHELRVVGSDDQPVAERHEGRIQFRGPSCTAGYHRNEAATRALFSGDWLKAGDRGYLADGEIYVTGRIKDLIIRAGRNIHPQEIEWAAAEVAGIRKHGVAAFAAGERSGTERLVVMAETRETGAERLEALRRAVTDASARVLDAPPDEVVLVPPRTVPKTSSGKVRRKACRRLYDRGLAAADRRVARQAARLLLSAAGPTLAAVPGAVARAGFGLRCWAAGLLVGLPGATVMMATPGLAWRAAVARAVCRAVIAVAGVSWRVDGRTPAAAAAHVVVANHASYLDGLFLRACLRGPFFFVAKRELARFRIVGAFLRRIGVEFVDRADHRRGLDDLERIRSRAAAGESLVAFPEGVLADGSGLRGFRVGPFMVAAQAGLPVLPVALRGTRTLLRGLSLMPHRSPVELAIGEPLTPAGADWTAALRLRDRARGHIVAHCGEPDLAVPGPTVAGNL